MPRPLTQDKAAQYPMTRKTGNPVGRPKAKVPVMGRPKGEKTVMAEYKARLLSSPQSPKVIQKIFDVALDDSHSHQAACMKMIVDRILPLNSFTEMVSSGSKPQISINISSLNPVVSIDQEPIEAEYEDA